MFAKVFASLWDGTLADQWETWSLFVFMLAHADQDGVVDMTHGAISRRSCIPLEKVTAAIGVLEAADSRSRSSEEGGRRIVRLDGDRDWGWRVVNYAKYRNLKDLDQRREQNRAAQAKHRLIRVCQQPSAAVSNGQPSSPQVEVEAEVEVDRTEPTPPPALALQATGEAPVPVIELPLRDGTLFPVYPHQIARWVRTFPDVLVLDTLREMAAWLDANPGRRKTRRGCPRFVTGWLLREQDTPRSGAHHGPQAAR